MLFLSPIKWLRRLLILLAALAIVSLVGAYLFDNTFLSAPFWEKQAAPVMPELTAALPDLLSGQGPEAANLKPYLQSALSSDYVTAKVNLTLETASDYLHGKSATALVDFGDLIPMVAAQGYDLPADQVASLSQPADLSAALARPKFVVGKVLHWKTLGLPVAVGFLVVVFLSAPGHHRWRKLGEVALVAGILFGLGWLFWQVAPGLLIGLVKWGSAPALEAPAKKLAGSVGQAVAALNLQAAAVAIGIAVALMAAHFLHPLVASLFRHHHSQESTNVKPAGRGIEH